MSYAALINSTNIPQSEMLNERQVANNAGGYVYALDIWARLDRFLILGSDSGTYYQNAQDLTLQNYQVIVDCWNADYQRTSEKIVEISKAGRAPKNSPAIFALAVGSLADSVDARRAALNAVEHVCRTASHLFEFSTIVDALGRGWGRALKRAVSNWYERKSPDQLAYQMTKYRARNDYNHKRLIQRVRPSAADSNSERVALYRWACGRDLSGYTLPDVVNGHLAAMQAQTASELVPLIEKYELTWEAIPTWALKDRDVWIALLPNLGMTALLRNLSTLTRVGVIAPLSKYVPEIVNRLTDEDTLRKSRIHPYSVLQALSVYRSGVSVSGQATWSPNSNIVSALDSAFYKAFSNVEPTGKRHMLAIDISGSMNVNLIGGAVSAREASAAMAMVTARTEPQHHFVGFGHKLKELKINSSMDIASVCEAISSIHFQRTDCAQPILHALEKRMKVDVFVVYTDNETYYGSVHPSEALKQYRKKMGIDAKLIVVGMTSTGFSIADPLDHGMLDIVGFDASAAALMADFVRE